MTDRRRHVRRSLLPGFPSSGSGDSLPSLPTGESLRHVVYRENVPPTTLYQSINSLSTTLSIPIFQQEVNTNSDKTYPTPNCRTRPTPLMNNNDYPKKMRILLMSCKPFLPFRHTISKTKKNGKESTQYKLAGYQKKQCKKK